MRPDVSALARRGGAGRGGTESTRMDGNRESGSEGCFVELYLRYQRDVYAFIVQLVHDYDVSEDLLQKTGIVLWRKFDQFKPDTNFLAWARSVAKLEVQSYLKTKRRDRLCFSSETIELLATEVENEARDPGLRHDALLSCLEQLRAADRELARKCYARGASIRQIAEAGGRSTDGVYQSLRRIRLSLLECIHRRLAAEGSR